MGFFVDKADPYKLGLLKVTSWLLFAVASGIGILLALHEPFDSLHVLLHAGLAAVGAGCLLFLRFGRTDAASVLLTWGYWVGVGLVTISNGGLRGPNLINYPLMIVVSGWLLGTRPTLVLAGVTLLFFGGLVVGDANGWVPPPNYIGLDAYLFFLTGITVATVTATLLSRRAYMARIVEAERIAGELASSERELRRHRDGLEVLVGERTRELEAARVEAMRLMQVKGNFLANMSHEIRTPLNGILGLAQIGLRKTSDTPVRENFGRILETGKLLQGIIDDVLDYSKIEAGKMRIEQVPVDLVLLFERTAGLLRERADAKGLDLAIELGDGFPEACLGDPLRLSQILMNLLSNAVKFTETGGVRLAGRVGGGELRIEVRDTGIGLSPDQLERIFDAFEQADSSTTRRFGGTGLGLAITQRLSELMEGRLEVESRPGEGSCFRLCLPYRPVQKVGAGATAPDHAAAGPRLAGCRVLVTDDYELNRVILDELLVAEGAVVHLAEHGLAALEWLASAGGTCDIVLMDIQMPVMDGITATARIRTAYPHLPVIGQSANVLDEERARCDAAGMAGYVTKPIDLERLVEVILMHWTPAGGDPAPREAPEPSAATAPPGGGVVDWAVLTQRFGDRAGFLERMLATAEHSLRAKSAELAEAIRAGQWEQVGAIAHGIKGAAGNLAAADVQRRAEAVQYRAAERPRADAEALALAVDGLVAEIVLRRK